MTPFSPGQLLLTGVPGPDLDAETARRLKDVQPGGFILFTRNIQSPAQLRKLIDDLRDLSDVEPVITIDQEGGRVSRLRELGNEPPNAQQLREKGDPALITQEGHLLAQNSHVDRMVGVECEGTLSLSIERIKIVSKEMDVP